MDYLIESLDDSGFLSYPIDQYITDLNIDREILDAHLDILHSFEPNGVGAADAIDSIIIQLKNNNKTKSYTLFRDYQDVILTQNYSLIKQKTGLKKEEIDHLFYEIRSCNPFPCNMYSSSQDDYISPDILIEVEDSNIMITPINQPELIVNNLLYEKVKNDENMKAYFNDAHFLIENLTKRNQTILFVANALVHIQSGYFLYDDELYPCTLSQLASETGFHESTISRTLNNKYYSYNGEVYPLKQLLVSQTASGDSSDSIKKAIVELVDSEDKEHPLSDNQILKKLEELELHCSRRVIVKYRQQLNIPSSTKRKAIK